MFVSLFEQLLASPKQQGAKRTVETEEEDDSSSFSYKTIPSCLCEQKASAKDLSNRRRKRCDDDVMYATPREPNKKMKGVEDISNLHHGSAFMILSFVVVELHSYRVHCNLLAARFQASGSQRKLIVCSS